MYECPEFRPKRRSQSRARTVSFHDLHVTFDLGDDARADDQTPFVSGQELLEENPVSVAFQRLEINATKPCLTSLILVSTHEVLDERASLQDEVLRHVSRRDALLKSLIGPGGERCSRDVVLFTEVESLVLEPRLEFAIVVCESTAGAVQAIERFSRPEFEEPLSETGPEPRVGVTSGNLSGQIDDVLRD